MKKIKHIILIVVIFISVNNYVSAQLSTNPTSAVATPDTICPGSNSTLSVLGGSLGSGANWYWYSNSCGGSYQTIGASPVVSPTSTITYYVRAEGTSNTTVCVSTIITVNTLSIKPTSAISNPSLIYFGSSSTLGVSGGSLGSGATWNWYNGGAPCGGNYVTSGVSPVVYPIAPTTYYVRAEGTCNTTGCLTSSPEINFYAGITSIGTSSACPGTITVPLNISNSPNVAAVGLEIDYNGAVLSWVKRTSGGVTNINSSLSNMSYAEQSTGTSKKFILSWYNPYNLTIANSGTGKICDLTFRYTYLAGTPATFIFNNSGSNGGSQCEYAAVADDSALSTLPLIDIPSATFYINGGVNTPANTASGTSPICYGSSTSLNVNAGTLIGATWKWYTGSCGGTYVTSGISPIQSPTVTISYYVRAEGTCNTSTCVTANITVYTFSTAPTSVTASPSSTICAGTAETLSETGGTLSSEATWQWYTVSCGGTSAGNGTALNVTPTSTTNYYVRAEGWCNNTGCLTISILVNTLSTVPSSVTANPSSTVCSGTAVTLAETGGTLGTGATWQWYTVSCGGTSAGNGTALIITPATNTNYYIRAEGTCNTTGCVTISVTVNSISIAPTSVTASPSSTVCSGTAITLTETGGTIGIGASWQWYTVSCGGTSAGNGTAINVTPTVSTNYYIRAEGSCNTTGCFTTSVTVNTLSTVPTSVTATPSSTVCSGTALTLTETGGTIGIGASWQWYTVSCGGTSAGNGVSLNITPTIVSNYYVRAEGSCNTTGCYTILITVNTLSTAPTSVTVNPSSTICSGTAITLTEIGGTLGTGATWQWYTVSCGGTSVGNGTAINITPTVSTNYYIRAEGLCNTTGCFTSSITVNTLSTAPTSVTATPSTTICSGTAITLTETGGTIGIGASWQWYTSSCGITSAGNGVSLNITPTITTNYYVRAEGSCNTTGCYTISITVYTLSTAPTSVTATPSSTICSGTAVTLTETGGTLGTGATWQWYSVSCGGTSAGNGTALSITPTNTTNYYVRAEGTCNTTGCFTTLIIVNTSSIIPASVSSTPSSTVCSGTAVTLTETGGTLGTGATWQWYTVSCGGTSSGNGSVLIITPTNTTNYYVRAEGTCNTTGCFTISITVNTLSTIPTSVTASPSSTVCSGTAVTLTEAGSTLGTGATWQWYTVSCGGTSAGNGTALSITPTNTTNYYVRAEGTCNTTGCFTTLIIVNTSSIIPASVTSNPSSTVCSGTAVTLTETGGTLGTGATWQWYTVSCGGTSSGNGSVLIITPTNTTNYYVRAEGTCNTTGCFTISITVNTLSTIPTSVTVTPSSTICSGTAVTLTEAGGTLGTGGTWQWYTISCGGTSAGNGTALSITATNTTNYYVRAEGTCNTTGCFTTLITVNTSSIIPASVTSNPSSTVCSGTAVTLTEISGTLGTGGTWQWYTVSCGGTSSGNGSVLSITPTNTTNYYIRAEGICNTTGCFTISITINTLSIIPTSVTASPSSTLCSGTPLTLSEMGGTLGTGGTWKWYTVSCGGTSAGNGVSLNITPTIATNYYVRAEGTCNTTGCFTISITINTLSTIPTSVTASPSTTVCSSTPLTLTEAGGTLGTGGTWQWYTVSCGGTSAGNGSVLSITPTNTTNYYVRAEGTCNTTGCFTISITINTLSTIPTSVTASPSSTVCSGTPLTLTEAGGALGTGGTWQWYTVSCGGTSAGNGSVLSITPTTTTNYYVRAEGTCNTTGCFTISITINTLSTIPASVSASPSSTVCSGTAVTLTEISGTLGTGGTWQWYTVSCGGTSAGNGSVLSITPTNTSNYYIRAEGICNTTGCFTISITINTLSTISTSVTASPSTTVCSGTAVTLTEAGGTLGTGGTWKWYTVSCGGTSSGNGSVLSITPTNTTNYFIRAESTCNTTGCFTISITINTLSTIPTSVTASPSSTVCSGTAVTLTEISGTLGTGGTWQWYTVSCGGTSAGNGSVLSITPTNTSNYYIRAEGICNTTGCFTISITVNTFSTEPASVMATPSSTVCSGTAVTLTEISGTLGTGATWQWYTVSCGGTSAGNGVELNITPTNTINYYVRAEGTCNTTGCFTISITINTLSTIPTSVTASPSSTVCSGTPLTLIEAGGTLGTGGTWQWYTVSCGGTSAGNGTALSITPTNTTNYYVRAEGTCNTTGCFTTLITVNTSSILPASVSSNPSSTVCSGIAVTLTETGGTLGTGATWQWYTVSCGGTSSGNGSVLSITPTNTTNYYVRAEGTCNTTGCFTISITINTLSTIPTSVTASPSTTVCSGTAVTFTEAGGTLGTGATWQWYAVSCGGTSSGNGSVLSITPTNTTNYYVRAEGICNTTGCFTITITVNTFSTGPASIMATPSSTVCSGTALTLTEISGTLGTGGTWQWYTVSCGGTSSGNGSVLSITPTNTTNYYVRAEGTCNTTGCFTISITINTLSTIPTSVTASPSTTVCSGTAVTFTEAGGTLGTGATWQWYAVSCGGTSSGNGSVLSITPTNTTNYYVRAEGTCNTTGCFTISITINTLSTIPASVSSTPSSTVCSGAAVTLSETGGTIGTGAAWQWYTVSCGGTSVGNGTALSITPTTTTNYYVRAEGTCNTTGCFTTSITVNTYSTVSSSVTATPSSTICSGTAVTVTETGGILGTGATWQWYTVSCGGTSVGNGTALSITPTTTTNYYVRAEGTCNTTGCFSISITINTLSTIPISVTASPSSTVCSGTAVTLTDAGGTIGTGATWQWYTVSCGGTSVGNGTALSITPTTTTNYYVRAEGTCNTTGCFTTSITVNTYSTVSSSVTATPSSTICSGTAVTVTETGGILGTGATWQWYTVSCGGTSVGNGTALSITPTTTTNYYVRAEGTCNTTGCFTISITINTLSTIPASVSSTPSSTVCSGAAVTLSETGGTLGTGATWQWYTVSCGGTSSGNGSVLSITPTNTTNYYVRAEGTCNTTGCFTISITINTLSTIPTSVTASPSTTVCSGTAVTFTEAGGTLGTGATWQWYTVSCGGTSSGNGSVLSITPTNTTNYYVRAEGTCNTTGCFTISITINTLSTIPTSVTASPSTTVCSGTAVTFTEAGGTLGTGATWQWYTVSCGGTSSGNGSVLSITPTNTTNYYVRAEGTCNTTGCFTISITINTLSTIPTSVSSTPSSTVCSGAAVTLSETGGTIGTGAAWQWYTVSCGGTSSGNGSVLSITPTTTTNYYVRAEGTCNTTGCFSISITINTLSTIPISVTASPSSTVCSGTAVTLTEAGGTLGTGGTWQWYTVSCGGTSVGNGTALSITPTTTTNYYVRAEGTCNTTGCFTTSITVNTYSTVPSSVTATPSSTICSGTAVTVTETGGILGTGATWQWYTVSCGGTSVGNGTALSITPTTTTNYYVRAEGTCNTTGCFTTSITVNIYSTVPSSVTATPSSTICSGTAVTVTETGGILGTGATWQWYTVSCGGTSAGNGTALNITPTTTTNYYVRAEGTCNSTTCINTIITVNILSSISSASTSPSTICSGSSTHGIVGGSLGTGAIWKWYTGSCGSNYIISGSTPTILPTTSTTYYIRAEGICNTTICITTTVNVNTLSIAATSALGTSPICLGSNTTLGINGGSLGTGAIWNWYTGSCGGTYVTSGTSPVLSPTIATTYYLLASGTCNTTTCVNTTIIVNTLSISAISATGTNPICNGSPTTLSIAGGSLGTGAVWNWYTGLCGGTYVTSGASTVLSPTTTTTYYVLALGTCNSTTCVTVSVNVILIPQDPISASSSPSIISTGSSSTLTVNGTLSSGAVWNWYITTCGSGSSAGTGSSVVVTPPGTTIYYVRAENGICYSNCSSTIVTIPGSLNSPSSVSASPNPLCIGQSTTISLTGTLGGGQWYWYSISCGGTYEGSGNNIVVSPTTATNYYARQELGSMYSSCGNILVNINTLSTQATSITGTSPICNGSTTSLSIFGGSLGTGATWQWYTVSCGGTSTGNGTTITVTPTATTTYYVRAEGTCGTTTCVNTTVTLNTSSIAALLANSSPTSVCAGASSTLTLTGGTLGTGATWQWYTVSCGGTSAGNGTTITVTPTATTTYYVRAEGTCATTTCVNTTVTLNTSSIAALLANSSPTAVCSGASSTLTLTGGTLGTGATWQWYTVSCGGTSVGNGTTITVTPTATTTYYVRAEGTCATTTCVNTTVTINTSSIAALLANSSPTAVCSGASSTLTLTGGTLGTGATWQWYTVSCGGTSAGNGTTITVTPTATTTYYVRAEGTCGTTTCVNTTVTLNTSSIAALLANSSPTAVCSGASSTLTLTGGTLGTGATWQWYTVSCGGTSAGNGTTITVTPTATTTYYVRAEGICGTTTCVNTTVTLNTSSIAALLANSSPTAVCPGSSSTLTLTGGTLGTGATWQWYTVSCGGTSAGNGTAILVTPTATTTYYVRAEGTCGTTTCVNTTVTLNTSSIAALLVNSSPTAVCPGSSSTLTLTGGTLGTGATWKWYTVSCGGTSAGNGTTIPVTPTITTTYYVRAEGTCGTTTCVNTTVTLNTSSTSATSANSSPTAVCPGASSTLTLAGGSLGTGATWQWYTVSCGGTSAGNGTTIPVTPTVTTTYYVRAEGTCGTTTCVNTTVTLNTSSTSATSANSSPTAVCPGASSTLTLTGGTLGTGAIWQWYTVSCGGTSAGNGTTITVTPTVTTIYYVRAEGTCATTTCVNTTVTLNTSSTAATSANSSPTAVCPGASSTLTLTGGTLGTGATWQWYTVSCGGTSAGNGTTINVTPTIATNYYVRAEGTCNTTGCITTLITVNTLSAIPNSVSAIPSTTVCLGNSLILIESGGALGTGATWQWYSSSCGGTTAGNGTQLNVTPTITTSYYIRAEGTCNSTGCITTLITVNALSTGPTSVTSSPSSTVCSGTALTLVEAGGTLGTGATWQWYTVSCGGTSAGNGTTINVTPTITANYYVRAEGTCLTTGCNTIAITVNTLSVAATGATGANPICPGSFSEINVIPGILGTGANWNWYTGSCYGTYVVSGASVVVTPTIATTYYASASGLCNATTCVSITVNLFITSVAAISASANPSTVCAGSPTTLSANGGILGISGSWKWYPSSCGGTFIATGNPVVVNPSATTTYFVRAEDFCGSTSCVSVTVTYNLLSVPATSVSANPSQTICQGAAVTLTEAGGTLGAGATWQWYTIYCGASSAGNGTSLIITPTITTNYYIRAEGTCNTTVCLTITVTANTLSTATTNVTANPSLTVCPGTSTTLTETGGSLGTGASWQWYTVSCGGISAGNGAIHITPTITTNYYIRAEGTCNTTGCFTAVVTVNTISSAPVSISANPSSTVCLGTSITLTEASGALGTGATWQWYTISCGGTSAGNGTSLIITPTITTNYYIRAEGTCNTTVCLTIAVTANTLSTATTNVTANPSSTVCPGTSTTLTETGGSPGTGASWQWYTVSCGVGSSGNGTSINVTPTITTNYYVRAEGTCNTTGCYTITITTNTLSIAPTSVTANPSLTICPGTSITLTETGGTAGSGATWQWYNVSCGGTSAGNGTTITVTPTATTTYYVRAEGTCITTTCVNTTITVNTLSIPANSATGTNPICNGSPTSLGLTGGSLGTGAIWNWFTGSCGGTYITSGTLPILSPTTSTIYYVMALGICNTTTCATISINVILIPSDPISATSNPAIISSGQSSTLSVNGTLSSGAVWEWYSGTCGTGSIVGTGSSVIVMPPGTTNYYVRAENGICYSNCVSTTITIPGSLNAPTTVTALPNLICSGQPTTISLTGTLDGGQWYWYSISCVGTFLGTGTSLVVTPTISTNYYVRQQLGSINSSCGYVLVNVNTLSTPATSAVGTSPICNGSSTTLSLTGGSLGTGAIWNWYTGSCGGIYLTSGTSLVLSPTETTTYYVLASGTCNTTTCVNITITVNTLSSPATSATGTSPICNGLSTTLSLTGGSLGTGAIWNWYTGSCGGIYLTSGTSPVLSPTETTTYYVLASGTCNTTTCVNITITVNTLSTPATSAAGTSPICNGLSTTLSLTGGSLGTGAIWNWYTGSCGGIYLTSGTSPVLSPTETTTYYVLASGTCNTTTCVNTTITVNTLSIAAASATGTSPICDGSPTTISITGGSIGTEAIWNWYTGSCGGTYITSGTSPILSPTETTTYYVLASGTCNTTTCVNTTITVNTLSIAAASATGTSPICDGSLTTLSITGGSLGTEAIWNWYTGSCGGTYITSGTSPVLSPTETTTYYVLASGTCNTTTCVNITITVNTLSTPATSATGTTPICNGSPTTLSITEGSLGTEAIWYWYTGSCGGTYITSGTLPILSPTTSTTYYVMALGICNTTTCATVSINVLLIPLDPTSTSANPSIISIGESSTLSVNGTLSNGATWEWYLNSCGTGTLIGTGSSVIVSPPGTSTYYVRAENGICYSNCISTIVTIPGSLIGPTSITALPNPICSGQPTTISLTGTLDGGQWYWYSMYCGGTFLGTGTSLVITPSITSNYYARQELGTLFSNCNNVLVNVNTLSIPATSVTGNSPVCSGSSTTLSIIGGSLGTGAIWNWYTGSCGGTYITSGISPVLSPTATTTYYVLAIGTCDTTTCVNIMITVNTLSTSATLATGTSPICIGSPTTLNITGGNLGTQAMWNWYTGSCGGTYITSGISPVLNPTLTTTYYVLAFGTCNTTTCVNTTITVNTLSTQATSVTGTSPICSGSPTSLRITGGSLGTEAKWNWYTGSCGGDYIASGTLPILYPTITTDYYVRAEGICNTTTCINVIVIVNDSSISATSAIATMSNICEGGSTSLGISGGLLGTAADWFWFTGSCGVNLEGNGTGLIVMPAVTTDYFVRAEGICNTTPCVQITVTVNDSSITAISATAAPDTICSGLSTNLGLTGGLLGSPANWYWYSGGCGVNQKGNGAGLQVIPTVTTDYFVRAEGACNTTPCVDVVVNVNSNSEAANTITALPDTLCSGESTQLSINGGLLGTLANWYWYSGTCAGLPEGNGNTLTVSPTVTTDYYVKAEGACNSTACINVSVIVNSNSILTGIAAIQDTIIKGNGTTLNVVGGFLGTGATWNWYTGSCSGNVAGQGDTLVINPMVTTTYFARGEGTCNTTTCVNITITVHDSSTIATSVTASANTICSGSSITLGINGGSLGTNADWFWYNSSCGANLIGNGATLTVMPTVTTDYYVRAEGLLNVTTCIDQNIVVNTLTVLPTIITANMNTINIGEMDTLRISDGTLGTGGMWYWYSGSCGGTFLGTGTIIGIAPTITTNYYIQGIGICDSSSCISEQIYVIPGYTVNGTFMYDQTIYPMDSSWLFLNSNGNVVDSTQSDINGLYQFNLVQSGTYTITAKTQKPWGGVNSTDAVKVKRHFAGSEYLTTSLRLHAADVNLSMGINTTDAVKISRRFVGSDTTFARGDWNFEKPIGGDTINVSTTFNDTIIVNGSNLVQNFEGICVGDVNASNVPSKSEPKVALNYNEVKRLNSGQYFEMPIKVTNDLRIGAISLILNYPKELLEVLDVKLKVNNELQDLYYNVKGGELRIGWFETQESLNLQNGESFIILALKTGNNFKPGDYIRIKVNNNSLCELADEDGEPIENVILNTYSIEHINTLNLVSGSNQMTNDLEIYPNPAKDVAKIQFNISESGFVNISLYNLLGEKIIDIINKPQLKGSYNIEMNLMTLPSGIYSCKMILDDNTTIVKRVVISR